ncbi:restriction endonuclease subunit S [Nonomuraea sp. 3N208]|uniref:restriction endonuclease subunit S n=1 Tax=Nonomuraea sp. 3N208 TaxID=3457421 RepID=UPI003FD28A41
MSEIDRLLAEHCPDGVEVKMLGEIGTFIRGRRFTKAHMVEEGIPCIHYGEIYTEYGVSTESTISHVREDLRNQLRYAQPGDVIVAGVGETVEDVGKAVAWLGEGEVAFHDDSFVFRSELDPTYVSYYFQTSTFRAEKEQHVSRAKMKRLSSSGLSRVTIPVPPPEVQREIVRILDKMTELHAELQAELQTELQARTAQNAFYWNYLLTPGDDWRRTVIGDIADVFDGPHATPRKTDDGPWYLSISSLRNGRIRLEESAHLSVEQLGAWTRRVAPQPGDTLFSYETRLGQAAYWDRDEPAALGRRMGLLRPKESEVFPRFLTLAYLGPEFQALIRKKTVRGATVERIPIADMASWPISIPPIDEQKRIVSILDKFDDLVADISTELSAEIEARRKQCEYYRDKLLTFEEWVA